MRRLSPTLFALLTALGCSSQSNAPSNPFLQADRVPPPTTRPLEPGAARPYYPGDPAQLGAPPAGAAPQPHYPPTGAPGRYAPTAAPPASAYPSTPSVGTPPVGALDHAPISGSDAATAFAGSVAASGVQLASAVVPANSSSESPPMSGGDSVNVPGDPHAMRFPAGPARQAAIAGEFRPIESPTVPSVPSVAATSQTGPSTSAIKMPIESILPTAPSATLRPSLSSGGSPSASTPGYRTSQEPSVSATERQPAGPPSASLAASDGFRPQGAAGDASDSGEMAGFRAPTVVTSNVSPAPADGRFGVGEDYQWLRGKLEYAPTTAQWTIRYQPAAAAVDRFGGSVLVENPQVLGDLAPGDYVMVRGQISSRQTGPQSYTAAYRLAVVQRQRL